MEKIKLVTDSTCDLSKKLLEKYDIAVIPLCVITDDEHLDGIDIEPQDIFEYVKKTKKLPKTAARSREDFKQFFEQYTSQGYTVIYIGIGTELSASYANACAAAEEIGEDKVLPVDSRSLSTGSSLLLIHAHELILKGKTAKQIQAIERERAFSVQASFVVDTLEYLYKGGRCSMTKLIIGSMLKVKPSLQVIDGKIYPTEKYRGKTIPVLKKYVDNVLQKYNNPDPARVFVTHACADKEIIDEIVNYVASKNIFKEVLVTRANATITCHCGKGVLGILYVNDGGRR